MGGRLMSVETPDVTGVIELLTAAAVEHDGDRMIRASVAARIIGIGPGMQTRWIRGGKIKPTRYRVPLSPKAPAASSPRSRSTRRSPVPGST